MRSCLLALAFSFLGANTPALAAPPEIRGVWIARDSLGSREAIAEVMETLKAAHFNVAYVNVWSRGYPLWQSDVFERATGARVDPAFADRDVLQEALEEGASRGITVVPWLEYGLVGWWAGRGPADSNGPLLDSRPEWLARRKDGGFVFTEGAPFLWMSHTNPEVEAFLSELWGEIVTKYDVRVIQLDRIRYPEWDCGYDEATRALYAAEHEGAAPPDDGKDAAWMQWRAAKLNEFTARLARSLKAKNWSLLVTDAPGSWPNSLNNKLQDYPGRMKDRTLDFVTPQVYDHRSEAYDRGLEAQLRGLDGDGERLAPGAVASNISNAETVRMVEMTRERKLPGIVFWYYADMVKRNTFQALRETVFSEPASLPWK
jgi:uncharacterized lipoprotein YddW (UPF0748 family)